MVLLGSSSSISVSGYCHGQAVRDFKIETLYYKRNYLHIFFNLCKACQKEVMSAIPMSAFSASRIRESQRDMKISNINNTNKESSSKYYNTMFREPSPLKYNSKLMNSIWGFYNRYSPHNVKKINDASVFSGEKQQAAISSTKNESMLSLPSTKLDSVWAAINVSQSH